MRYQKYPVSYLIDRVVELLIGRRDCFFRDASPAQHMKEVLLRQGDRGSALRALPRCIAARAGDGHLKFPCFRRVYPGSGGCVVGELSHDPSLPPDGPTGVSDA